MGQHRMRWLDSISNSRDTGLSKLYEILKDRGADMLQPMGLQIVRHDLATEQQQQQNQRYPGIGNTQIV